MRLRRGGAGRLGTQAAVVVCAAVLAAAGCSAGGVGRSAEPGGAELTVFAASSLTESFTALKRDFVRARPGVRVRFSFQSSSALARQLAQGAPADVFAAANPQTMRMAEDAGRLARTPTVFARNRLQIATLPGNPHQLRRLADLTRSELKVALCASSVPCGAAAAAALRAGHVTLTPDTYEKDVKAVMTKVTLGEVDAGLVYRTDVQAAGDGEGGVEGVDFPEAAKAVNDYLLAPVEEAPHPAKARAFVTLVRSAEGRAVMSRFGFQPP